MLRRRSSINLRSSSSFTPNPYAESPLFEEELEVEPEVQIDELLKEEEAQLKELETQLERSHVLTEQMIDVLASFNERLTALEDDILPVYSSTKKSRTVYFNLDGIITEVGKVKKYFNTPAEVRETIENGPHGDYEKYSLCVKQIIDADEYLRNHGSSFVSTPHILAKLEELERTGQSYCDEALINLIGKSSTPIDLKTVKFPKKLNIPATRVNVSPERIKEMVILATVLQSEYSSYHCKWINELVHKRSNFIMHSVEKLRTEEKMTELVNNAIATAGKDLHPFCLLLIFLIPILEGEKEFVKELVVSGNAAAVFCSLVDNAVNYIVHCGEAFIRLYMSLNVYKRIPLYDVQSFFSKTLSHRFKPLLKHGVTDRHYDKLKKLGQNMLTACQGTLDSVSGEIGHAVLAIRENATVDQVTSSVLDFLSRLSENPSVTVKLLQSSDPNSFSTYTNSVIIQLVSVITRRATTEKDSLPATIYVLNNLQHIYAKVTKSQLQAFVPLEFLQSLQKDITRYSQHYLSTWNKIIAILDTTVRKSSSLEKSLKAQLTEFNTKLEEIVRAQQKFIIPDKSLKEKILHELKDLVLPAYDSFISIFNDNALEKDKALIKYNTKVLDHKLSTLLAGQQTATPKKKTILGIKM